MVQNATYLDYNSGAPPRPQVLSVMGEVLGRGGNASSVHGYGRLARQSVETARRQVAVLAGADPSAVVFTSGGTEANNTALAGYAPSRVIVSAVEHDSVYRAVPGALETAVTSQGRVDLDSLRQILSRASGKEKGPLLVAVMLANNETGILQPMEDVVALAREFGAKIHCDAVQAAGRMVLDIKALGVDSLSLSAHKLGGPQGVGALVLAKTAVSGRDGYVPLLRGGGQERGLRAGTENVAAIAGFGKAAELAIGDLGDMSGIESLRDGLETRVRECAPRVEIFGAGVARLANTSCFALPNVSGETQVMALDLAGVAISAGAACSSGRVEPSRVLRAMGVAEETAVGAIRVSLGWNSKKQDIDIFIENWRHLVPTSKATGNAAAA